MSTLTDWIAHHKPAEIGLNDSQYSWFANMSKSARATWTASLSNSSTRPWYN